MCVLVGGSQFLSLGRRQPVRLRVYKVLFKYYTPHRCVRVVLQLALASHLCVHKMLRRGCGDQVVPRSRANVVRNLLLDLLKHCVEVVKVLTLHLVRQVDERPRPPDPRVAQITRF